MSEQIQQEKMYLKEKTGSNVPGLEIVSFGNYVPTQRISNDEMNRYVETNDEWITTRTGIKNRHFAEGELNAEMAAKAAEEALNRAKIKGEDIGYCIVTTFTPDNLTPSVACHVQELLGLPEDVVCFDVNGACSGFLYGLQIIRGLLMQDTKKCALLIGSEMISRVMDFTDRATCVLFGDASAAAVVRLKIDAPYYFTGGTRGDVEIIKCALCPVKTSILMNGKEVFRFATQIVEKSIEELCGQAKITPEDIDFYVCHQANKRIIDHVRIHLQLPEDKFYLNLQEYGNTSSTSIPLALEEMSSKGLLKRGMKIVCVGFGAGLTWGGVLMEY